MGNDLISRSALLEKVQFRLPIDNHNAEVINGCVEITRGIIQNAPAVDAVEVVQCKDCFYNESGCCTHSENYDDTQYRADYFCADGLRRTDDG